MMMMMMVMKSWLIEMQLCKACRFCCNHRSQGHWRINQIGRCNVFQFFDCLCVIFDMLHIWHTQHTHAHFLSFLSLRIALFFTLPSHPPPFSNFMHVASNARMSSLLSSVYESLKAHHPSHSATPVSPLPQGSLLQSAAIGRASAMSPLCAKLVFKQPRAVARCVWNHHHDHDH